MFGEGEMRTISKPTIWMTALLLTIALTSCASSQEASRTRSEYVAEYGATVAAGGYATEGELLRGIMPAEEIRIEEYLNYYDQDFPAPPPGSPLGINAKLGSNFVPYNGGEVWLQIGLQAGKTSKQDLRPLNVVLVLDRSGSMADKDKMDYLKQSLRIFLEELAPEDFIAIVVYDTQANVLLPAQPVGDGARIRAAIEQIRPGGSTNLHGGLMLGYREAQRYYSPDLNNRVILLTDGIANEGVTDPDDIAADSLTYNQQGIFLSTIGLGLDFNDDLLSTLAEQGKGNYHFINDAEEMERVFKTEAAGLVQSVATDVWLTLDLIPQAQVERVYGYGYELRRNIMHVQLDDVGAESNQILMIKMVLPPGQGNGLPLARMGLTFTDPFTEQTGRQEVDLSFSYGAPDPYNPLIEPSVRRNATLLTMAETLQQVSYLCDQRRYQEALGLVMEVKGRVWEIATQESDEQMQEDVDLLTNYETILEALIEIAESPTFLPRANYYDDYRSLPGPCGSVIGVLAMALLALGSVRLSRRWLYSN
jgi:Ca-activated chloride channel family protein